MRSKTFIVLLAICSIMIIAAAYTLVWAAGYLSTVITGHGVILVGAVKSMSVSPTSFDFGTIDPTTTSSISKTFTISNTGNIPWNITSVVPNIGGATPSWIRPFFLLPAVTNLPLPLLVPAQSSTGLTMTVNLASGAIYAYMVQNNLVGNPQSFTVDVVIITDAPM